MKQLTIVPLQDYINDRYKNSDVAAEHMNMDKGSLRKALGRGGCWMCEEIDQIFHVSRLDRSKKAKKKLVRINKLVELTEESKEFLDQGFT